jgi:plasmid stabilization system protein ParE
MKVCVHPQARVDLLEIWHHIAKDSIKQANKVAAELEQAIRDLGKMPGKGHTGRAEFSQYCSALLTDCTINDSADLMSRVVHPIPKSEARSMRELAAFRTFCSEVCPPFGARF